MSLILRFMLYKDGYAVIELLSYGIDSHEGIHSRQNPGIQNRYRLVLAANLRSSGL